MKFKSTKCKTNHRVGVFCARQGVCQLDMTEEEVNFIVAVMGGYEPPMS